MFAPLEVSPFVHASIGVICLMSLYYINSNFLKIKNNSIFKG